MFDHFPLLDETLRHIELCNIASSITCNEISQNFANSAWAAQTIGRFLTGVYIYSKV